MTTEQQKLATAERQLVATLEWIEQLTQVKAILQQKLAAAVRQLVAALEWFEQLTQLMATLQKVSSQKRCGSSQQHWSGLSN